jgi:hypothetical protein
MVGLAELDHYDLPPGNDVSKRPRRDWRYGVSKPSGYGRCTASFAYSRAKLRLVGKQRQSTLMKFSGAHPPDGQMRLDGRPYHPRIRSTPAGQDRDDLPGAIAHRTSVRNVAGDQPTRGVDSLAGDAAAARSRHS